VFINQHDAGTFPGFLDQWLSAQGMPAHMSVDSLAPMATIAANQKAYGASWPALDFNAAKLVISFGADFLDGWGHSVPQQLDWADARAKLEGAPRLVYVGARRSLTGLNADQWIAAKPGSDMALCAALTGTGSAAAASDASGVPAATIEALAAAIKAAGTGVMAICGVTTADAVECGVMVADINKQNGSVGTTAGRHRSATMAFVVCRAGVGRAAHGGRDRAGRVRAAREPCIYDAEGSRLRRRVLQGAVQGLLQQHARRDLGIVRPRPARQSLAGKLGRCGHGGRADQPAAADARSGVRYQGDDRRLLIELAKKDQALAARYNVADYRTWYLVPRRRIGLRSRATKPLVPGSPLVAGVAKGATAGASPAPQLATTSGEVLRARLSVVDARRWSWREQAVAAGAAIPSLLACVVGRGAPQTFKKLGLKEGQHLTVQTAAGKITAPVYRYMGVRTDTVAVALGQGHTAYGRFARNIGVNAYDLVPSGWDTAGGLALSASKGTVTVVDEVAAGRRKAPARQHGRGTSAITPPIFVGGGDEEHHHNIPGLPSQEFQPGLKSPIAADAQGEFANPKGKAEGMYDPEHSSGMEHRRWAMTIDLARCTGCSACVTACYSENNIRRSVRRIGARAEPEHVGANIIKGQA
jgi:molybdopterin-containing oxidoreductase family iron-sulfur binding subunit